MDFSFSGLRTLLIVPKCFLPGSDFWLKTIILMGKGACVLCTRIRNIFESPLDVFLVIFFASRNSIFFIDALSLGILPSVFGVSSCTGAV